MGSDPVLRAVTNLQQEKELSKKDYLVCSNPRCRFVLDPHINGHNNANRKPLEACPNCGSKWSDSNTVSEQINRASA